MKKTLAAVAATAITVSSAAFALTPMERAVQGNYCNGAAPVSAEILPAPDGRLKVVCPRGSLTGGAGSLSPAAGAGLALAGVLVVAAAGSDDAVTSSTATTGGS